MVWEVVNVILGCLKWDGTSRRGSLFVPHEAARTRLLNPWPTAWLNLGFTFWSSFFYLLNWLRLSG